MWRTGVGGTELPVYTCEVGYHEGFGVGARVLAGFCFSDSGGVSTG